MLSIYCSYWTRPNWSGSHLTTGSSVNYWKICQINFLFVAPWRCSVSAQLASLAETAHKAETILLLYYEESLISSNLNSKLFRFHCVKPNVNSITYENTKKLLCSLAKAAKLRTTTVTFCELFPSLFFAPHNGAKNFLIFRSSHFWFLVFGHFWRQSHVNIKILRNLCLHFARQDGQDGKKTMQQKWPKTIFVWPLFSTFKPKGKKLRINLTHFFDEATNLKKLSEIKPPSAIATMCFSQKIQCLTPTATLQMFPL